MDNENRLLPNYEQLYRELIAGLKDYPVIWDKNHGKNKCKDTRDDAYNNILERCKALYPSADYDFVKTKIESIRNCFRKERRKIKAAKESPSHENYVPSLWYYNLMLFTVGEEPSDSNADFSRFSIWNKNDTVELINLLKKYPILYRYDFSSESYSLTRKSALRKLTEELNTVTGNKFQITHVRMKIRGLKNQYRKELQLRQKKKGTNMWCFHLLNFMKDNFTGNKSRKKKVSVCSNESDEGEYLNEIVKEEQDEEHIIIESKINQDFDDVFDTIGKNVAHKLRDMTDDQRAHAERILNDIMYHGLMEDLNSQSALVL